jgi:hypothetical protein
MDQTNLENSKNNLNPFYKQKKHIDYLRHSLVDAVPGIYISGDQNRLIYRRVRNTTTQIFTNSLITLHPLKAMPTTTRKFSNRSFMLQVRLATVSNLGHFI